MSLTDEIYAELIDGLEKELDWQGFLAKYGNTKGPLYNALGRAFRDIKTQITALDDKRAKLREELDQAGLKLNELTQKIEEAESNVARLEDRKNTLSEQIESLQTKVAEKAEFIQHAGALEKLGFDVEKLSQLRDALREIAAKHGLKGKEGVTKFFNDLKNYETVLGAELLLQGLQTQIETKKLEAENWQAKEETLRRKHDDLKEVIGALHALRTRGIKVGQVIAWHRILNQFETVEQFDQSLAQYGNIIKLLNARKEETESYELRLTKAQSEVETLEKERVKIEAAIDALRLAGLEKLKAMTEAVEKQVKRVAAREIKEAQDVAREIRSEFANYFTQLDKLLEKAVHLGEELERSKQELQKYEGVKTALDSHAVASEEVR